MILLLALIPATMLTVAGYGVMYLAHRSEGGVRSFGKYLAFWAFTLAALVLIGAIIAAAHVRTHRGYFIHGRPGMMMRGPGAWGPEWCPMRDEPTPPAAGGPGAAAPPGPPSPESPK